MNAAPWSRAGWWAVLAAVLLFLLGPLLFVFAASLNSATSFPAPFQSLTLSWFARLFDHEQIVNGLTLSLVIAACAAVLAVVVGFPATYTMMRWPGRHREWLDVYLSLPILVPEVVVSIALLQAISALKLAAGAPWIVAAHATAFLPFVVRICASALQRFDFGLEDAAHSLGASRMKVLARITVPLLRPQIVASLVLVGVLSFVNLPLSLFLATPESSPFPVVIFAYMESRIDPLVAAAASAVVLMAIGSTLLFERVLKVKVFQVH
jgi:putative spermidine/putrescine transport system permease protein